MSFALLFFTGYNGIYKSTQNVPFSRVMNSSNNPLSNHHKMFSFSDNRQRLTNIRIRSILKRCQQCYKLTNNAKNILYCSDISDYKLHNFKKTVFFINTWQHWLLIGVFPGRQCLVIDPLDMVKSWPDVTHSINSFCQINSLELFFFDFRFQRDTTQICGFLCLWITFKISKMPFIRVWRLRNVLSSHRISTLERGMMWAVHKHFRL